MCECIWGGLPSEVVRRRPLSLSSRASTDVPRAPVHGLRGAVMPRFFGAKSILPAGPAPTAAGADAAAACGESSAAAEGASPRLWKIQGVAGKMPGWPSGLALTCGRHPPSCLAGAAPALMAEQAAAHASPTAAPAGAPPPVRKIERRAPGPAGRRGRAFVRYDDRLPPPFRRSGRDRGRRAGRRAGLLYGPDHRCASRCSAAGPEK